MRVQALASIGHDDRSEWVPAGHEIGKPTFGQISWPTIGGQSIAVAAV